MSDRRPLDQTSQDAPQVAPPGAGYRRRWPLWLIPVGCLVPIVLCAGIVGLVAYGAFQMLWSVEPYSESLARVQQSPEARELLGEPIEAGWMVTGNVELSNGEGTAVLRYPVSGPEGGGEVEVRATKTAGQWHYEVLRLLTDAGSIVELAEEDQEPTDQEPTDQEPAEPEPAEPEEVSADGAE